MSGNSDRERLREAIVRALVASRTRPRVAEATADVVLALPDVAALLDAAEKVRRVRELHVPDPRVREICSHCSDEVAVGWPCDTIRALDGDAS